MNTSLLLDNEITIKFCSFINIQSYEPVSAGISINKKINVSLMDVYFYKIKSIYSEDTSIGPALNLWICTCSISKCCFSKCYGPKASTHVISSYEVNFFSLNALIYCGFNASKINSHPSYFIDSTINEHIHNNISKCGDEYFYFVKSEAKLIKYDTTAESKSNQIFYCYECSKSNKYEFSYCIRCNNCKQFGFEQLSTIFVNNCYFIDSYPKYNISDTGTQFSNCYFTMSPTELEEIKGNAVIINPQFIKGGIVEYQLKAACRQMKKSEEMPGKIRICLSFFFLNVNISLL